MKCAIYIQHMRNNLCIHFTWYSRFFSQKKKLHIAENIIIIFERVVKLIKIDRSCLVFFSMTIKIGSLYKNCLQGQLKDVLQSRIWSLAWKIRLLFCESKIIKLYLIILNYFYLQRRSRNRQNFLKIGHKCEKNKINK